MITQTYILFIASLLLSTGADMSDSRKRIQVESRSLQGLIKQEPLLNAEDIQNEGFYKDQQKTRPFKFWRAHPEISNTVEKNNELALENAAYVPEEMFVYLGKDKRTMVVSRSVFADIDAEYFPHAYITNSIPGRKSLTESYTTFRFNDKWYKDELKPNGPVKVILKRLFKGYPHWGLQIGNKEVHINGKELANGRFAMEGTVVIGDHYKVARKTAHLRRKEDRWQTDGIANAYWKFPSTEKQFVCETKQSDGAIWSIVNDAVKQFFVRQFDPTRHNCHTLSVDIADRLCKDTNLKFKFSIFNKIIAPCLVPIMGEKGINNTERVSKMRHELKSKL